MEHLGWNGTQPSPAWISQQQEELLQQASARGFSTISNSFNSDSFIYAAMRIDPGFATLGERDEVDSGVAEQYHSLDQSQEKDVSILGNALSQQQQNLSSSGSSQVSDYVLATENNAKSSAVSSRKRKAAEAEDDDHYNGTLHAHIGRTTPVEIIKFNDRRFGPNSPEIMEYSSSSADCSNGGFKLITAKKAATETASEMSQQLPKSSNISFQLQATSSDKDTPDSETIAEMKEMLYMAAAFRPVNLGLDEAVEKPKRKNMKISSDPQTAAARQRRERISDRIRVLQRIVPGGNKMDTATMLDEAANYLKFLRSQVKALEKTAPNVSLGFSSYNFLQ